jgi:hypothetical protein
MQTQIKLDEWINKAKKYQFPTHSTHSTHCTSSPTSASIQYYSENNYKKSHLENEFGLLNSTENAWTIHYGDIEIKAKLGA